MMKVFTIFLFISSFIFSNDASIKNDLIGKWFYNGSIENEVIIECPDVILFKEDGSYTIFNDCAAANIFEPVIEFGQWEFSDSDSVLVLQNRKFPNIDFVDYVPYGFDKVIRFKLLGLKGGELILEICKEPGNCIIDVYKARD